MKSVIEEDISMIVDAPLPWNALSGAKVLITGASGFLPAYMAETILSLNQSVLAKPAQVVGWVRDKVRAQERFAKYIGRDDLELVVRDVSEPDPSAAQFDYVIHAASQASPRFYKVDPVGTLTANVQGTYHLLNSARNNLCRGFLFFSSGDVYGNVDECTTSSIAENQGGYLDPADPRSCYGESKRIGETMCVSWAQQFGVPARIVRPGHTYGPGMRLNDGRVFADFVRDIMQGGPITLLSDGEARRSFCYLTDATIGFFTVLLRGKTGHAYNVSNPDQECSIAELADRLAVLYSSEGLYVDRRVRRDSAYVASPFRGKQQNVDKLKALGWKPKTTIEEGFRRTVKSYREHLQVPTSTACVGSPSSLSSRLP